MTPSRSLPARPSLDSLRKQAKKLARDTAAGDAEAIARARAQAPKIDLPLTQRHAQLVIAREYGFAGWQDLTADVSRRLGHGFEWATKQAWRIIHDDDVDGLQRLLAAYPALLAWGDDHDGGLLGMATEAYGDASTPEREHWFTRARCAELLLDAGAIVTPGVCRGLLDSRARGLLELFHRKGVLPRTLPFLAARGDLDALRAALADDGSHDLAAVTDAFEAATRFGHEAVAAFLLERCIARDPALGRRVDGGVGRADFVAHFIGIGRSHETRAGLWLAFVKDRVSQAVSAGHVAAFVDGLRQEPRLLGDDEVPFQDELIASTAVSGHAAILAALLDLDPAILRRQPPPASQAYEHAFTYGNEQVVPLLARIWPMPDDLPHAAGMGDLARVQRWFDAEGRPALGDVANHQPATSVHPRERQWGEVGVQQVVDTALAWAVINRHFEVADFLLAHGADVSTTWNSHEPASILHHLVFQPDPYDSMRFLVDRGIDMTIKDYRWSGTAWGWAHYAKRDQEMADWLADAERSQERRR
jgi:hypothetical protein